MKLLILLFFLHISIIAFGQETGTLRITITGVNSIEGAMAVAIYNNADAFLKKDFRNVHQRVKEEITVVEFKELPAGLYAVSLFHDINNNKELDKNFIGLPNEPYAFGNDSMGMFGPPSFKNASIIINAGEVAKMSVTLR